MKTKYSALFTAAVLGLTLLACAVSGTATAPPPPTVDSTQLDLVIAQTVSAALAQTASAPTATSAASATPVPEPTATPTAIPQTSITHQPDGNAIFLDEKANYALSIPPGWLPIRIDQMEYYDAFSLPQAAEPAFQAALLNISALDPDIHRLFIFDIQDGHLQNDFVNNVNLLWQLDQPLALETEDQVKALAEALPAQSPGLTVTGYSIAKNSEEIPIGIILSESTVIKEDGSEIKLFQKQVLVNLESGSLILTFTSDAEIKDATLPAFDGMIESLSLID
ncbi:MAG: hypothetical protein IT310_01745 [Anaerolineales bacterium]|nr:hypothetical protein [Anaerolineales bacterium]